MLKNNGKIWPQQNESTSNSRDSWNSSTSESEFTAFYYKGRYPQAFPVPEQRPPHRFRDSWNSSTSESEFTAFYYKGRYLQTVPVPEQRRPRRFGQKPYRSPQRSNRESHYHRREGKHHSFGGKRYDSEPSPSGPGILYPSPALPQRQQRHHNPGITYPDRPHEFYLEPPVHQSPPRFYKYHSPYVVPYPHRQSFYPRQPPEEHLNYPRPPPPKDQWYYYSLPPRRQSPPRYNQSHRPYLQPPPQRSYFYPGLPPQGFRSRFLEPFGLESQYYPSRSSRSSEPSFSIYSRGSSNSTLTTTTYEFSSRNMVYQPLHKYQYEASIDQSTSVEESGWEEETIEEFANDLDEKYVEELENGLELRKERHIVDGKVLTEKFVDDNAIDDEIGSSEAPRDETFRSRETTDHVGISEEETIYNAGGGSLFDWRAFRSHSDDHMYEEPVVKDIDEKEQEFYTKTMYDQVTEDPPADEQFMDNQVDDWRTFRAHGDNYMYEEPVIKNIEEKEQEFYTKTMYDQVSADPPADKQFMDNQVYGEEVVGEVDNTVFDEQPIHGEGVYEEEVDEGILSIDEHFFNEHVADKIDKSIDDQVVDEEQTKETEKKNDIRRGRQTGPATYDEKLVNSHHLQWRDDEIYDTFSNDGNTFSDIEQPTNDSKRDLMTQKRQRQPRGYVNRSVFCCISVLLIPALILTIIFWDGFPCINRFEDCSPPERSSTETDAPVIEADPLPEPDVPMGPYVPGNCDLSDSVFPHISQQCDCHGKINIIPESTRNAYYTLVAIFTPTLTASWNFTIESCDPMNLALLFLASGQGNTEQVTGTLLQRYIISYLYYQLNGPRWRSQELWLSSESECLWSGIKCDNDGFITEIELHNNNATGQIPSDISRLTRLDTLSLAQNRLNGSIPSELFDLTGLKKLLLFANGLTGQLPSEIGSSSKLRKLYVSGNSLEGTIPTELFKIRELQDVRLAANNFVGSFPTEVGNVSKLAILRVFANHFEGAIPSELGHVTFLRDLDLGFNNFSEEIPTEIFQLTRLESLSIEANTQITGRLPTDFGLFTDLQYLSISDTNIRSRMFSYYQNLTNLKEFRAANTGVGGDIPTIIGNLTSLTHIDFGSSNFRQPIPSEIGLLTQLTHLQFNDNQFEGSIPTEIGLLTKLTTLLLAGNLLSGDIPTHLGQLTQLEALTLDHNNIATRTPDVICDMRNDTLEILTTDCPTRNLGVVCPIPACCTSCSFIE